MDRLDIERVRQFCGETLLLPLITAPGLCTRVKPSLRGCHDNIILCYIDRLPLVANLLHKVDFL